MAAVAGGVEASAAMVEVMGHKHHNMRHMMRDTSRKHVHLMVETMFRPQTPNLIPKRSSQRCLRRCR